MVFNIFKIFYELRFYFVFFHSFPFTFRRFYFDIFNTSLPSLGGRCLPKGQTDEGLLFLRSLASVCHFYHREADNLFADLESLLEFFIVTEPLTVESAPRIWEHCNRLLRTDPEMSARGMIRKANVALIGTTDDPVDSLQWHEKLAADETVNFKVCPSFRPDKALNIHKAGFTDYMTQLAASVGKDALGSAQEVCDALIQRIEYFHARDCRASDHGFEAVVPFRPITMEQADAIYRKAIAGQPVTQDETEV